MKFNKPKDVKAAVMVKPGTMEVRTYPYPTIDDKSAILKIDITGICGTDKHLYKGETLQPGGETQFPVLNGHEIVGTIIEIGKDASLELEADNKILNIGDRVTVGVEVNCGECWFCKNQFDAITCEGQIMAYGCHPSVDKPPHLMGGWAEYMYIFPKSKLFKIPENMPNGVAVFIEEMAVAVGAFIRASQPFPAVKEGFGPGDSVAILGNGALGILHGIMGRILGAGFMVGTDLANNRLEAAKSFYADETINASNTSKEERIEKVRELTNGRGPDLVIETAGRPEVFIEALELVRLGGTVLELGNWVDVGENAQLNVMRHITGKNLHIHGLRSCGLNWEPVINIMRKNLDKYPFEKLISHRLSLNEVVNNMEIVIDPNKSLKSVVVPHKSDSK